MISLEQIRKLEEKVQAAVTRISVLNKENETLRTQVAEYERRLGDLQGLVDAFKQDQDEIEAGIVSVLKHLDQLEDRVGDPEEPQTPPPRQLPDERTSTHEDNPAVPEAEPEPEEAPVEISEIDDADDESEEEPELDIF